MALDEKTCVPCRGGIPPMGEAEARRMLEDIPGWKLTSDHAMLKRKFEFKNFKTALNFVNKVGEIAEKEGHHPDITFGWGYADISIYTHKIGGLHENDFILAAKINAI